MKGNRNKDNEYVITNTGDNNAPKKTPNIDIHPFVYVAITALDRYAPIAIAKYFLVFVLNSSELIYMTTKVA
ncbi:MAG: hypothetical protein KAG04_01540, partial [Mycoplasmataceae bacterium]|nr:hypothetical protein [Mycoplasmataceae bacterium]